MDLKAIAAAPTPVERQCVDGLVGPPAENGAAGRPVGLRVIQSHRHLLLPVLHALQLRTGWISAGALGYACERLGVPPAEGYGVASFYALFALSKRPARVVHVCDDIACRARAPEGYYEALEARLGAPHQTSGNATWHRSPCLGMCDRAPAALVVAAGEHPVERAFGCAKIESIEAAIGGAEPPDEPRAEIGGDAMRLLARCEQGVDPTSIDAYREAGGYVALREALRRGAAWVLREVRDSGLLGRGGAAFPTGTKWEAVARATAHPRYVICNADESEPGTFKDRVLMEEDPFAIVEAMTIAGFTVGAERGFIYLRGEYPRALERLTGALEQAKKHRLLGNDIMGRGVSFDIEIRRGAGAYICGEETALLNSLEGFRGEPRNKPPYPVEAGLFGKPTLVNNVETLANVPLVLTLGAAAFKRYGTEQSAGTRLFCVSGCVERPGLYEVGMGKPLSELIAMAGGVAGGRAMSGILMGGAAGVFMTPAELDMPLSFEGAKEASSTLGSGVVVVFDEATPMVDVLVRIAAFFRDESCGQCVPCRVGTVRQEELLQRLARRSPHRSLADEAALLRELGCVLRDASICGLGQTASSAIESAVRKFGLLPEAEGTGAT